jgi:glutaredoxin 3
MPEVVMYSTAVCPYCVAAKNFLKSRGLGWREVRVDLDHQERRRMMDLTRRTSVPQIFINGTHVGGYDDLVAMDRRGELAPLLEDKP